MPKLYYKEKVIGSGTFGNVWLVKSKFSNSAFVMKEINLASMNATEIQQALTEVTVLSRCRHKNIIKYKDAIIDHKNRMLSIIMEYADGGDLYTAIIKQRGVPFKEHTVISWFTQLCLALQYIHHMGILHRDLKSRNIFLTREGQIKVGDFGIARCLMETNELATTAIGTPYYLSPEICNRKPYNHKSDMWAAGCILFEMAALSHPFQACNFPHLVSLIITGQRRELPRYYNSVVKDLVQELLEENPEIRPSADDILDKSCLQPYLSEMWVIQNTNNSSPAFKVSNQEINARRYSLRDVDKDSIESTGKRRASVSCSETRGTKTRFGFGSKVKNAQSSKVVASSRSHSLKVCKNSPKSCAVKKEQFLTYKVLNPVTLKERITNILSNGLKTSRGGNGEKRSAKSHERYGELENQDEYLKRIPDDAYDFGAASSITQQPLTSTKKHIDILKFQIEESTVNDVFESSANETRTNPNFLLNINKNTHSECSHSQCQQCILDILWKNRIRGVIGPLVKPNERSELIRKLQEVFGKNLFDTVYHVLISNWENSENADTPKSLRDITNYLNYSQLQHLPLMMQLIQLDVVPE